MNNKLSNLFHFLKNKNLINKEAKIFKLNENQKEKILSYIDSLDFEIKVLPSTELNLHSKEIFNLIKDQIFLTYKPYLKSYIQDILDDSAKLNKLMKTMFFDEDYFLDRVTKSYYKDPYMMIMDLIKSYRGFLFEIIFSTRFENPCPSGGIACNDMSDERRIFFLIDKIFDVDFKLKTWLSDNLLVIKRDEVIKKYRSGTKQVYLGEGKVLEDRYENSGGAFLADFAKKPNKEQKKRLDELLEKAQTEDDEILRTFRQELDLIPEYISLIKININNKEIKFSIGSDKLLSTGKDLAIKHDDLPDHVKNILIDEAKKIVNENKEEFVERSIHVTIHEMTHTKHRFQSENDPGDKLNKVKGNPSMGEKDSYELDQQYDDASENIEKGFGERYGWPYFMKKIIEDNIPEHESNNEEFISNLNWVLQSSHKNNFGIQIQDLTKKIYGSSNVTSATFKGLLNKYNYGDRELEGHHLHEESSLMFSYLKIIQQILKDNPKEGNISDLSRKIRWTGFSYQYPKIKYTFKKLIREIIAFINLQAINTPKENKRDLIDVIDNRIDGFNSETIHSFGSARKRKLYSIFCKYAKPLLPYEEEIKERQSWNSDYDPGFYRSEKYLSEKGGKRIPAQLKNELINPVDDVDAESSQEGDVFVRYNDKIHKFTRDDIFSTILNNFNISFSNGSITTDRFHDDSGLSNKYYIKYECDKVEREMYGCLPFLIDLRKYKKAQALIFAILKKLVKKTSVFEKYNFQIHRSGNKNEFFVELPRNYTEDDLIFSQRLVEELNKTLTFGNQFHYTLTINTRYNKHGFRNRKFYEQDI